MSEADGAPPMIYISCLLKLKQNYLPCRANYQEPAHLKR